MRFRLRISRAILLIAFGIVFIAVGVEAYFSYATFRDDRDAYTQSDTDITYAIAGTLLEQIQGSSSPNSYLIPPNLLNQTHSLRLAILKRDGSILEEQPPGAAGDAIPKEFSDQVLAKGIATRWKPGGNILETGVALAQEGKSEAAVLIRESDLSQFMASTWLQIVQRIGAALLVGILIALLVLFVSWRFTLGPMKEMQEVAEKIFAGDMSPRVQPLAVKELDQIGGALNRMLDGFQTQHTELEELNRNLETTIQERTFALERTNLNLNRQTRGLRLLNAIASGGTNSLNLTEFCDRAVKEIIQSLDAASGILTIQGNTAIFPDPLYNPIPEDRNAEIQAVEGRGEDENGSRLSAAIYGQDDILGQIEVATPRSGFWGEEDCTLLDLIGHQLGAAAERIHAYQLSRETNWMMGRLVSSSEQLNQYFHETELFPIIGNGALSLAAAARGAILVVNAIGQIEGVWRSGVSQGFLDNLVERGLEGYAFNTRRDTQPILIYNFEQMPSNARRWWQENGEGIESAMLIPLIYEGTISAYAVCFYMAPGLPGFAHVEIMEAFARQAATSLENTRLIEAERQQHVLAEALRDVSAALTSTLEPDEVFERILINLGRVVKHDAASIMMIEGDRLHVIRGKGYPTPDGRPEDRSIPIENFPHVASMVRSGEAVIIPNTSENPEWVFTPETRWMYSYAGAPVCARGKVIGIINLIGREHNAFLPSQVGILHTFADQAAIAIENARLFQATHRKMIESTTLYRALTGLLSAGGEGKEISERIVRSVTNVLNVSNCELFYVDHELGLISAIHQIEKDGNRLIEIALDGPGLIAASARQGETIYAADVSLDPRSGMNGQETYSELIIPMFSIDKPFAVLNVERPELDGFDLETRQILVSFAERASLVLENARLLEAAREQSRCTALLNEIARISLENSDISISLEQIVRQVAELVRADGSYITLWDEARCETVPLAAWELGADGFPIQGPDAGVQKLTAHLMKTGQVLLVSDMQNPDPDLPPFDASFKARSYLGVPLISGGQPMGAIMTGYQEKRRFAHREIGLLEHAAVQIALGMAKIRLLEATQRRAEESERLRQATAALTTRIEFEEVIKRIAQHLPSLIHYDSLAVFIVSGGVLKPAPGTNSPESASLPGKEIPIDDPLFSQMTITHQPVVLFDAQQDPRFHNLRENLTIHSWTGVPLFAGDQVVGYISLGRFAINPFLADEILLVQVFANQAGAAIQNALLLSREQQLAITDPLTNLYNRRGFQTLARHELERSLRFGRPLTLLMMDIDHFKLVNDNFGHSTGDEVLRELSGRLKNMLREVDLMCRYGGEEFCVILPESDPKGAMAAAERLRLAIETKPFIVRAFSIPITISIGVASMTNMSQSLEELVDWADAALLRAKTEGRNRVTSAQSINIQTNL